LRSSTGARGYLGKEIARYLVRRGFRVRGVGRVADVDDPNVHEWVTADLGRDPPCPRARGRRGGDNMPPPRRLEATRLTSATRSTHEKRPSRDERRHVRRLVYVSSLAVLRPAHAVGALNERTPLARSPRKLGPYIWGKCTAEQLVTADAARLGIVPASSDRGAHRPRPPRPAGAHGPSPVRAVALGPRTPRPPDGDLRRERRRSRLIGTNARPASALPERGGARASLAFRRRG